MKKKNILISFIIILAAFLSGCNGEKAESGKTKRDSLTLYTTIYPLQDFTKKIAGPHAEVKTILAPGADAHTFEPTQKLMVEIAESSGFIYMGAGVEGFAEAMVKTLKNEEVKIIEASSGIEFHSHGGADHEDGHEEENHTGHEEEDNHADHEESHEEEANQAGHNHGDVDPHVWLDPAKSIMLAENIKNELIELKPEAKKDFEENFSKLKEQLIELDNSYKSAIAEAKKKEILVSHAAYGYWEDAYGLEQISVSGLSPTDEPSQKDLKEIIETAEKYDIKFVLFEQNVSGKIAEIIQKEIGAKALTLHNLEALTDEDIDQKEDYFSIMKKNLETLKKALN